MNVQLDIKSLRVFDYNTLDDDKIYIFEEKDSHKILELLASNHSGMEFSIDDVELIGDIIIESEEEREHDQELIRIGQAEISELRREIRDFKAEMGGLGSVNEELRGTISDYASTVEELRDTNDKLSDHIVFLMTPPAGAEIDSEYKVQTQSHASENDICENEQTNIYKNKRFTAGHKELGICPFCHGSVTYCEDTQDWLHDKVIGRGTGVEQTTANSMCLGPR
tara:strand:+ start:519 stop:1190 length:672 start_codon:yes stop_codon:yes gene_type:complete